jgi:hypothetical protein
LQIGFLTEWQLYAQKIEGDGWTGEKLDPGKVDKMSGERMGLMPPSRDMEEADEEQISRSGSYMSL